MANFNEKINSETGYILCDQEFLIYRCEAMKEFERMIDDDLYLFTNTYRLFIQYKTTHRAKKVAGRCFLWDNSHGDHMKDPGNGIELRSMNDASKDDCEGFGNPRFDGMVSAILITDRYVFFYGDVCIEAAVISRDKKHVYCDVSLCGSLVSNFRIPAQTFDRQFGLKENLPTQYRKRFLNGEEQAETKIECDEVSFADSDECEQDETGNAQIVAETAQESTNEEESTELILTGNERITDKIVPGSYWRELFGSVFFDKRKCQEDIEDVKLFINYAIGLLRGVLCIFDDTQESVEKNAGLNDDGLHLLRKSKVEMDVVRGMLIEMINNVGDVEWRACKYRCTDAKNRDLQ